MAAFGLPSSFPLIWTEGGISSASPPYLQEGGAAEAQAWYAAKVFPWMFSLNISSMNWFWERDNPNCCYPYSYHGLTRTDGSRKHSFYSYKTSTGYLSNATYQHALSAATNFANGPGEGYTFARPVDACACPGMAVVWNRTGQAGLSVSFPGGAIIKWVQDVYSNDLYGPPGNYNPPPAPNNGYGPLPLPASDQPYYIFLDRVY